MMLLCYRAGINACIIRHEHSADRPIPGTLSLMNALKTKMYSKTPQGAFVVVCVSPEFVVGSFLDVAHLCLQNLPS